VKKWILTAFVLWMSISLLGCGIQGNPAPVKETDEAHQTNAPTPTNVPTPTNAPTPTDGKNQADDKSAENAVVSLVQNFGKKLQMVSLQAPKDAVAKSMKENYGEFVTPELLAKWQSDPLNAPGRLVSSPWPDRIEVLTVKKLSDDSYKVEGNIIEITSAELKSGGAAAKRPIILEVKKNDSRWLIGNVALGAYEDSAAEAVVYENTQYGFKFALPKSWKGYTIVTDKWEGVAAGDSKVVESGPMISIRHPKWTKENPRQDIPIMVMTAAQWDALQQDKFHIGAAPVGPKELGRNSKYVFALPARYNFAFLTGYEEVDQILNGNPLQPIQPK